MNVSKLAGESMIKNLSQLRPVKFLGLVSVMDSDDDDVCGRNKTEASKLSLSGILNLGFEADEDLVCGWQLAQSGLQTLTNISIYKSYCARTNFL